MRGDCLSRAIADLSKDGWRVLATPPFPTGRSAHGTSGGEWLVTRKTTSLTSFEHWRAAGVTSRVEDPFRGFCPGLWHTRAGNIVVVARYLLPGHKLK
eukprot:8968817-Pyramimonas_sp.AAC.1